MIRKTLFILLCIWLVFGCASNPEKNGKCPRIFKNKFTSITNDFYKTIYKNDTITYNEVRYECVYSSLFTHKVMFDNFGKWDKEIFPKNRKYPILIWYNVDLFSNGKTYSVLTNGLEEWKHIYASVMVFDNKENDLLAETSAEKEKLVLFFGDLLKNQDHDNKSFYEPYWKMVDPKRWEYIEKHYPEYKQK